MVSFIVLSRICARYFLPQLLVLTTVILVSMAPVCTAASVELTPTLDAGNTTQDIHLDGKLDELAWQQAGTIHDLVQQDPVPGGETPYTTEVRVLVDSGAIYIGFSCNDPDPSAIAVHTMQRDGNMNGDDKVAIVFDPAIDGRRGYYFQINSAAARLDGLVTGPESISTDWDGIWDAATQRTAEGWTAEIRIPAQTLRFPWGQDHWGFNVQRYVARDLINLRWSGISLDANFADLRRAGRLTGVAGLGQGRGLSISPYGLVSTTKDYEPDKRSNELELGGDLTWNFSGDLTGYLTVNPDFAETEVDTRQANLTRFPLFFPEKRSFFLEGSDIFNFGSGLNSDFIPFFSRRIGLFDGEKVPLPGGVKLLGRVGPWQLAGLAVAADETDQTDKTTLFSGRLTYDINENLTVGAIATYGDPEGQRDNSLTGLDFVWQTSSFRGDKNFSVGGWAAASQGDMPKGDRSGWGFKVDYPNDLWDLSLTFKEFGTNLDPALGFLPRPGTRWYQGGLTYMPRPESGAFSWVRQFFFEFYPRYIEDANGQAQSWRIFTAPFNARTHSGEHIEANIMPSFEHLDEPFEIADGVIIPVGDYHYTRYRLELESASHRAWRVGGRVWFGDFFSGTLTETNVFVSYTTPAGHLRLEASLEHDVGQLPEGDFTFDVAQFNVVYAFTPDLILSSNIQYDSESRDVGTNTRFRWTIKPGNDLFIVWNHGWQRPYDNDNVFDLQTVSDQLVAKLRWTFRM